MRTTKRTRRSSRTALLILDMLSEFDFPDGDVLRKAAARIAPTLARLRTRCRARSIPVIYVNDTAHRWESDQRAFVERCLEGKGAAIAAQLQPAPDDYFMFKPRHSAFYATPLAELLYMLKVEHLVLSGVSSHQCVLLTASDAHVRGLDITVATDCIAAGKARDTHHATYILEHGLQSRLRRSMHLRL